MDNVIYDMFERYSMDSDQAKAYQLCFIWLETIRKVFPDDKHYRMPKKGDPRKSMLFKYCYKLVKETRGIIEDQDYYLYIRAQLDILKAITNGQEHAMVEPNVLVGDKAWVRWRVWKKKYDAKKKVLDVETVPAASKVREALERTKVFLFKHFQGQPTFLNMQEAAANGNIQRWAADKRLSSYYLATSTFISKLFSNGLSLNLDFEVYRSPETMTVYEEVFGYEIEE